MVILLVLAARQGEPATGDKFGKITELDIVIETLPSATSQEGITKDQLAAELTVQLKAKIPRLKIVKTLSTGDWLYLDVYLDYDETVSGRKTGYSGWVSLALAREVIIQATGTFTAARIWQRKSSMSGPLGGARSQVKELIGDLVTAFAAEYYKAGNP
jgi:hypothetical protein